MLSGSAGRVRTYEWGCALIHGGHPDFGMDRCGAEMRRVLVMFLSLVVVRIPMFTHQQGGICEFMRNTYH